MHRVRVPIDIHPSARSELRAYLMYGELESTGVGFSAFILAAVKLAQKHGEEFRELAQECQSHINLLDRGTMR